jgi:hypothetical protein
MLVLAKDRDNPWTPPDANLMAWAARGLVKRHLAPDASGWISGRGSWIVDGVAGLYEGFARKEDRSGDFDPERSWHLAAARALGPRLFPWARLVEMDRAAADAERKSDVDVEFGGAPQKASKIDVVAAQATAFALGVMRLDAKQGERYLATLLEETYRRDRMPDLDKAIGKKEQVVFDSAAAAVAGGGGK